MLSKRAQVEDNLEYVLSFIIIIIGVVALTLLRTDAEFTSEQAKDALYSVSFETTLMQTDLLNTLKLKTGDYTFGELIAYMPRNYQEVQDPALFEDLFWDVWLVDGLSCNTELYNAINNYLSPVYGKYWRIEVFYHEEQIFKCQPADITYGFGPQQTNLTLPTTNPGEDVFVTLEVFQ